MRTIITALLMASVTFSTSAPAFARTRVLTQTPEEVANSATQDHVMLMKQMHFDGNGRALPAQPLTREEAIMTAQIEQFCTQQAKERIKGKAGSLIKKATLGSILLGIFGGIGSLFFPFAKFGQYAGYAGASGFGSGAFTGSITIEQAQSVFTGYCQISQIYNLGRTGDRRLNDIIAAPVVGLKSSRMAVDWNAHSEKPDTSDSGDTSSDDAAPSPVIPQM